MAEYNSNTEKAIEILTNGESGMYWETGSKILRAIHQMQKATEDDSENKTEVTRLFASHKNDKTGLYNKNDTGDNLYDCH